MLKQLQVDVEAEAYDLGQGVVKFVADVKKALDDGWQPGQDLPVLLQATLVDLVPAIKNVSALGPDLAENEKAFVRSFLLSGQDMVYVFKK